MGLRSLERTSLLHSGGRRVFRHLLVDSIYLKKDWLSLIWQSI